MKLTKTYCLLLLYVAFIINPIRGSAEENQQTSLNDFSYEVIMPENQKNKEVGYYDLAVEPGKVDSVQLKLNNLSPKPITLLLKYSSAKTNSNGVIEYGPNNLMEDPSLHYDFSDIVTGPDKVAIEPKQSETVSLVIRSPKEPFDGYIAGGIQIMPQDNLKTASAKDQSVVTNKFAFLVGMLLSEKDVSTEKPELVFNSVSVDDEKGGDQLILNFSNVRPVFAEEMSVDIQVKNKANGRVAFSLNKRKMRMAPNTQINLPIDLQYRLTEAGNYTIYSTITVRGGESWSWEQEFSLSEKEVQILNKRLEENQDTVDFPKLIMLACLVIFIAAALVIVYLKKSKRRNKRSSTNSSKKKL